MEEDAENCEDVFSSDVMTQLSSGLELTMHELAACRDCCDEAQNQLARLSGSGTTQEPSNETRMQALNMFHTLAVTYEISLGL